MRQIIGVLFLQNRVIIGYNHLETCLDLLMWATLIVDVETA